MNAFLDKACMPTYKKAGKMQSEDISSALKEIEEKLKTMNLEALVVKATFKNPKKAKPESK